MPKIAPEQFSSSSLSIGLSPKFPQRRNDRQRRVRWQSTLVVNPLLLQKFENAGDACRQNVPFISDLLPINFSIRRSRRINAATVCGSVQDQILYEAESKNRRIVRF